MKAPQSNPPKTMLTITVGFLVFYVIWRCDWMLKTAVVLGLIGVLSTWLSEKIEWLWLKLSQILGLIMPNILLTIVFYIFLLPFALLSRLFGNADALKLKNNADSVYNAAGKKYSAKSFEHPW